MNRCYLLEAGTGFLLSHSGRRVQRSSAVPILRTYCRDKEGRAYCSLTSFAYRDGEDRFPTVAVMSSWQPVMPSQLGMMAASCFPLTDKEWGEYESYLARAAFLKLEPAYDSLHPEGL